MITERDLQEAIAECEGQKNPNVNTCIKLAAFYTIKQNLFPSPNFGNAPTGYSYASGATKEEYNSGTDFSNAISGADYVKVMSVIDELMATLEVINPSLYNGVMRKLSM